MMHDRENVSRSVAFEMNDVGDGQTLEGYAAVFNEWTTIRDRHGEFRERLLPGSFKRTLGTRMPVLQFDHGAHPLIGSVPLGRITKIEEDARGLFVRARLSDNWLVEPVRDAIRDGAISGMSFRFTIKDEDWVRGDDGVDERTIGEVALYEVGPVVFPAYEQTSVGVRARQVASALTDPEVRHEVAQLITSLSTDDLRSLADESPAADQAPASATPVTPDAPAEGHARTRTHAQRQAIARLALDS